MFDVGLPEIAVLLIAALFVFGPERLPTVVAQAAKALRQVRTLAAGARAEIDEAIGPELRDFNNLSGLGELGAVTNGLADLRDLSPRKFLTGALSGPVAATDASAPSPDPSTTSHPATAAQPIGAAPEAVQGEPGGSPPAENPVAAPPRPAPAAFDADAT